MADVHNTEIRSYNMSRIKGTNTKPEMLVRRFLHSKGFRYSLHNKKLPGSPDLTLTKYKTVIFVNGCFWHGHKNCKYFVMPKTKTAWWKKKIEDTIIRDEANLKKITELGWSSLIIWECELKSDKINSTLNNALSFIKKASN